MEDFKELFESERYRLGLSKTKVLEKMGVSRPTLLKKLNNPENFKAWEILALVRMGFNLDYFKNLNKFKY